MYNFLKDTTKHNHTTISDITRIEEKYSIKFPSILKNFYLDYDGNKINLCKFDIEGYLCEVAKLIPLNASGLTFEKIVDNDRIDGFISKDFYPIASNRGGDFYYWSDTTEKVYLILADDIENPFEVSKSIEEFFEILNGSNQ